MGAFTVVEIESSTRALPSESLCSLLKPPGDFSFGVDPLPRSLTAARGHMNRRAGASHVAIAKFDLT